MGSKRHAIWVDEGTATQLDAIAERLEAELGFRPTHAQLVKYLIEARLKSRNEPVA